MSDWNTKRAQLNHDLLKNQVIPTLDRMRRLAQGSISGKGLLEQCREQFINVWSELYTGLMELLKRLETDCGPSSLFSTPPLTKLDHTDLQWMRELTMTHCSYDVSIIKEQILNDLNILDNDINNLLSETAKIQLLEENDLQKNCEKINLLNKLEAIRERASQMSYRLSLLSPVNILQCLPKIL